ncbi:MAG: ABC transporter substrate-binding protein [Candidatus Rokubacteria bacterium]|nr:ABC transporter substrate-binding protein [Candidatus Rokubacteria bacterium]
MFLARAVLLAFTFGLLAAPLASDAQQAGKLPRVGFLCPAAKAGPFLLSLGQGLREFGYVEGQNISIEARFAEEREERLPDLAAELVRLRVDILVPMGPAALRAAKRATNTIPIVMAGTADPVGIGLVASLARPGGNITGLTSLGPELAGKRLELLKEVLPGLRRIAVFWDPTEPEEIAEWKAYQVAAGALRLQLRSMEVRVLEDPEKAFSALTLEPVDALINTGWIGVTTRRARRTIEFAAINRLPVMGGRRSFVEAGGFISYAADYEELYRRAAAYMDKILKGAKPADLPVEEPRKFELVINVKTAKALGIKIPQSVLMRADQVIQ